MGPISLFDKSFIQSLNVDESVWFDHFYRGVICPIFWIETLGNLKKEFDDGKDPSSQVAILSSKTPEFHSTPTTPHWDLGIFELLGGQIELGNRPHIRGGTPVEARDKTGIKFEIPPEQEALERWRKEDFTALEEQFASKWRSSLESSSTRKKHSYFNQFKASLNACKNADDLNAYCDEIIELSPSKYELFGFLFGFLNFPQNKQQRAWLNYQYHGCPPLRQYAPYTAHLLKVELFFSLGMERSLISSNRASHAQDFAYFYYLPFCNMFISGDKLHKKHAKYFLGSNQEFVWAQDLKSDLKLIDEHYSKLPKETRIQGIGNFAHYPPETTKTHELNSRFSPQIQRRVSGDELSEESHDSLLNQLVELKQSKEAHAGQRSAEDSDFIIVEKKVRLKKGKWYQVPKSMEEDKE